MCICLKIKSLCTISFTYMSHITASQLLYFNAKYYILLHINPRGEMSLLFACINVVIIIWSILIISGSGWELLSGTLIWRRNATFRNWCRKSYLLWPETQLKHCGNKGLCLWELPCLCLDIDFFFTFWPIFHITFPTLVLYSGISKY